MLCVVPEVQGPNLLALPVPAAQLAQQQQGLQDLPG